MVYLPLVVMAHDYTIEQADDILIDISRYCEQSWSNMILINNHEMINKSINEILKKDFSSWDSTILSNLAKTAVHCNNDEIKMRARVLLTQYMNWFIR